MGIGTYMKGQGATEYLVILAVVLIIALVAIGIVSQTASGSGAAEKTSRAYWKTEVFPLTIDDYKYSTTELTLVLNNRGSDTVTILANKIAVTSGTTTVTGPTAQVTLTPGTTQSVVIIMTALSCTSGASFSVNASIVYSTPTLSSLQIVGKKPIVGTCS